MFLVACSTAPLHARWLCVALIALLTSSCTGATLARYCDLDYFLYTTPWLRWALHAEVSCICKSHFDCPSTCPAWGHVYRIFLSIGTVDDCRSRLTMKRNGFFCGTCMSRLIYFGSIKILGIEYLHVYCCLWSRTYTYSLILELRPSQWKESLE